MSFTGDLEHLPIVDVIQLLHATRKSGILRVSSRKGESQLVFKDGFIVSANHLNNTVRIGKILIDRGVITPEVLNQTLEAQKSAGHDRKPLVITMIEKGVVNERDAYKGLEQLIEMTVVEILTWKGGTFTLDVMPQSVADEYRYFPEKMSMEINVDTQGILMNALRIFDEKMRDGELRDDDIPEDDIILEASPTPEASPPLEDIPVISVDDLGLAELDHLETRLPEVHAVLDDKDPSAESRRRLEMVAPELTPEERDSLIAFLREFSSVHVNKGAMAPSDGLTQNILLYSCDELLNHCITTVCKDPWMSVFATSEEQDIDLVMDRFKTDRTLPLLVLDYPIDGGSGLSSGKVTELRTGIRKRYPQLCIIQLASPHDHAFAIQAYDDNVRAVLPRPFRDDGRETFIADTIQFLKMFRNYVKSYGIERQRNSIFRLGSCIRSFLGVGDVPEAAIILLKFVAGIFERSVTLIVREKEMIAEKGIGIRDVKGSGSTSPPLGFRIPLSKPSLFNDVIDKGKVFYGASDDAVVREHLFAEIGAPDSAPILLLPLRLQGKTISITYADFGGREPAIIDIEQMEILVNHAEVALENALYRKRNEKQGGKD